LKNQFAEEFERSEKETNLIKNFYKAKANEVLIVYDEKISGFVQNKPSSDELVSFSKKLKDSLLTKYEDSVLVGKLASNFNFKLLKPNENLAKNEIFNQLYQRTNENDLNANNEEESSPFKSKIENFSKIIEHGYFYTVINVLFTLVIILDLLLFN